MIQTITVSSKYFVKNCQKKTGLSRSILVTSNGGQLTSKLNIANFYPRNSCDEPPQQFSCS